MAAGRFTKQQAVLSQPWTEVSQLNLDGK